MSKQLLLSLLAAAAFAPTAMADGLPFVESTPASGATVKSISTVRLTFSLKNSENMVQGVPGKISEATLQLAGADAVSATEWQFVEDWPMNKIDLVFPTQTAAGTYTLTVPAGVVGEYGWDDAVGDFALSDGLTNAPVTATYTVDPAAPGVFDTYRLDPADGTTVGSISEIALSFPNAPYGMDVDDSKEVVLTNGAQSYTGEVGGWGNEDRYIWFDEPVTGEGTWTLHIPAGTFSGDGEQNGDIEATYTINPLVALEYVATPANGATQELPDDHAVTVTFEFPNASSVDKEPWEDPNAAAGSGQTAGFRVTYGGESIPRVANALNEYGYSIVDNWGDPLFSIRLNKDVFKVNGKLEIDADRGAFTVDGMASPAIQYSLNFGENKAFDYTLSPENDAELTELGTFTVAFPTAKTASFVEGSYVVLTGNNSYQIYAVEEVPGAAYPTFTITFDPAPDASMGGSYTLNVEKGSFILDGTYQSPEIRRSYTLKRTADIDMSCVPSPTGNKVVADTYGTYVAFVFSEDETVTYSYSALQEVEVLFDGEEMPAQYREISFAGMDGNKLLINIYDSGAGNPYVGKAGTLTVTIPAGLFTISGQPFGGISHTWEVVTPKEYTWYTIPAEGTTVSSLGEITIVFDNAETALFETLSFVNLRASDYSSYHSATSYEAVTVDGHPAYKFTFDPAPTKFGEYMLLVNYGAFLLDDAQSTPNIEATFTLSELQGISGIQADENGLFTAVTLDGRVILRDASAAQVKSLDKGFYIINGKKTVIR